MTNQASLGDSPFEEFLSIFRGKSDVRRIERRTCRVLLLLLMPLDFRVITDGGGPSGSRGIITRLIFQSIRFVTGRSWEIA